MSSRLRALTTTPLASATATVLAAALTAALLVAGLLVGAAPAQATSHCYGPRALTPGSGCDITGGSPSPSAAVVDRERSQFWWCQSAWLDSTSAIRSCSLGNTKATRSIAVVGDSHATSWLSGLNKLGLDYGWKIKTYTRSACTPSMADPVPAEATSYRVACAKAMRTIWKLIAKSPDVKVVVTAGSQTSKRYAAVPGLSMPNPDIDGFTRLWDTWRAAGKTVVVLPEVPRPGRDVPVCLMNNWPLQCAETRSKAFSHGMMITRAAQARLGYSRFRYPLLNERFCNSTRCFAQVGGVITFRDHSHISNTYSRLMSPYIAMKLGPVVTG